MGGVSLFGERTLIPGKYSIVGSQEFRSGLDYDGEGEESSNTKKVGKSFFQRW